MQKTPSANELLDRYIADLDRLRVPRREPTGAKAADVDYSSVRLMLERAIQEAFTAGAVYAQSIAMPSAFVLPVSKDFDLNHLNHWTTWDERQRLTEPCDMPPPAEAKACAGASVPCPSWQETSAEVVEVCSCTATWGQWGNPWGDPTCPIHGEKVAEQLKRKVPRGE